MDTTGIGLRGAQEFYFYPGPVDGGRLAQGREDAARLGMEGWKTDSEEVVIRFGEREGAKRRAGMLRSGMLRSGMRRSSMRSTWLQSAKSSVVRAPTHHYTHCNISSQARLNYRNSNAQVEKNHKSHEFRVHRTNKAGRAQLEKNHNSDECRVRKTNKAGRARLLFRVSISRYLGSKRSGENAFCLSSLAGVQRTNEYKLHFHTRSHGRCRP